MVSAQVKSSLCMGFGAVGVLVGAIMVVFWPPIFFSQLKNMMILTNESYSFTVWRETPLPMYLECFMWNISNVDEILAGTARRLHFVQMGPYVFREEHIKVPLNQLAIFIQEQEAITVLQNSKKNYIVTGLRKSKANISFNDNATVTFYNQRWWHYEPEMSNGSLSDDVTSINPVIATVAYMMRHERLLARPLVDLFLRYHHSNLFLTANASAWLFDGIEDPVLDIAQEFPTIQIPYDKFGWFYDRNGSMEYDGVFLMRTGADDFSELGNVVKWRNSNRTLYRDECGAVKGSTGELWAPELGQPEVVVFAPDICSYITLSKNVSVSVDGIEGVMYAANDSVFDNGYRYPHMACYCDAVRDSNCLPPGALNVSSCRFGAPAFVSLPHFYNSDPYYPDKVDGLTPNSDHTFRLSLEMYTGIPLTVAAQLQINLLVRHITGITINNQLPDSDTLVPMFWFRQEVRITPEYARMARFALNVRNYVPIAFYITTVIGLILLISGITVLIRRLLYSPDNEPILRSEDITQ